MLRPRITPCLLVHEGGLVKTVGFEDHKYVGDPINAVKIFNEKEADELIVLDIDATVNGNEIDYNLISHLAAECRMPLCYGGGVQTSEQVKKIIGLGVEKVAISSAAIDDLATITGMAEAVGRQSIVVVMDVRKNKGIFSKAGYEIFTHNGKKARKIDPITFAREIESAGAGEIVINSIDHDGLMNGYDLELIQKIRNTVSLPMSVLGGAGSLNDIKQLIDTCGVIGAAVGSLFVFKGKYRAVLINYPNPEQKEALFTTLS